MANQSPIPVLGTLKIPQNYPTVPAAGKIQILFDANKKQLYHKLSPYGYDTFLGIKTRQPFQYTYPDEGKSTPGITDQFTRAITDVKRVAKFMGSQNGIFFLGKQFLLQTGNAFNETRIWNPTSPIVAAGLPLTLYEGRPTRHIDTSDLLGSFLGNIGKTIGGLFGTGNKPPTPPPGTLGRTLPTNSVQGTMGGKGLLRAGTANKAKTNLTPMWGTRAKFSLGGFLSETLKGLFGNFLPQRQNQSLMRSDQIMYGLMLGSKGKFDYDGATKSIDGVQQFWFGGSVGTTRKDLKDQPVLGPLNWKKYYMSDKGPVWEKPKIVSIKGLTGTSGYVVSDTQKAVKYGKYVGKSHGDDWESSDVLIQYSKYAKDNTRWPSKFVDQQDPSVQAVNQSLQRVIDNIQKTKVYSINPMDSSVLMTGDRVRDGYERIVAVKRHGQTETGMVFSALNEYRGERVLENQHSGQIVRRSKKMASTNQFDGINTLRVLDKSKQIKREDQQIPGWTQWQPYHDDQIAFYFYDVVNEKYIPFRAIIRGLQENDSANWEELSFIGRADRLYSYSGFNRSLTFSFTVHISSIIELAPTWQRINYLMSLVKPSNYTRPSADAAGVYTRFMVPPMVMVTIGDLYKNQPIVIASAGITIPDTAIWETLNEANSSDWSYLVDFIRSPNVGKRYGQFPLTAEISINAFVLEQERAIAGAAHFGRAPHTETYKKDEYKTTAPDYELPSEIHKDLVVYNPPKINLSKVNLPLILP